jgi:lipopolysaccharide/colanic/teichoic acid biosynthesis glycosyltransferase
VALRQTAPSEDVAPTIFEVVTPSPLSLEPSIYGRFSKRAFDIVVSLVLLIALSPLIAGLAVAVLVTSGRPVFYGGVRMGKDGRPFRMWKLRTMVPNAEALIEYWKQKGTEEGIVYLQSYKLQRDPRITPLGRFLRKTSLDELPQLWNVLKGDMSIVGPRPIVEGELEEKYGEKRDVFLSVRPGITGLWQVSGRNQIDYPERANLELSYVLNLSALYDASILLRTVPVLLRLNGR